MISRHRRWHINRLRWRAAPQDSSLHLLRQRVSEALSTLPVVTRGYRFEQHCPKKSGRICNDQGVCYGGQKNQAAQNRQSQIATAQRQQCLRMERMRKLSLCRLHTACASTSGSGSRANSSTAPTPSGRAHMGATLPLSRSESPPRRTLAAPDTCNIHAPQLV